MELNRTQLLKKNLVIHQTMLPSFHYRPFPKDSSICVMFHTFCVCEQLLALVEKTTLQEMNISKHTVINGKKKGKLWNVSKKISLPECSATYCLHSQ